MGSVPYILQLREDLQKLGEFAQENLRQAERNQELHYNQGAKLQSLNPVTVSYFSYHLLN